MSGSRHSNSGEFIYEAGHQVLCAGSQDGDSSIAKDHCLCGPCFAAVIRIVFEHARRSNFDVYCDIYFDTCKESWMQNTSNLNLHRITSTVV